MNQLFAALMTKMSGSAFYTDMGGRIYLDEAPEGTALPYAVFFVVSDIPDDTFAEKLDDVLIQFSLFSSSKGAGEIATAYNDLKALFDGCVFTMSSATLLSMSRDSLITMTDLITTISGTISVKHWAVEYTVKVKDL